MKQGRRWLGGLIAALFILQTVWSPFAAVAEETYTVTFDLNGHGSGAPEAQTVTEGETTTQPESPSDEGYDFAYWSTDPAGGAYDFSQPVSGDLYLYAIWTEKVPESFTLTLTNASCDAFSGESGEVAEGTLVSVTAIVPSGMYFSYWEASGVSLSDTSSETVSFTMPSGAVSLSAVLVSPVTVSFDLNGHGSTAPASQTIKPGTCAAAPENPTDAEYDFAGWTISKTELSAFDFSTPITADTTLYALWNVKGFTLTLTDAEARDTADQVIASGMSAPGGATITVKAVVPEGKVFDHWEVTGITLTEAETKAETFIFTMPFAAVTVKAVMVDKTYKVSFDLGGHGGVEDQEVKEGDLVKRPSEPTAEGFQFVGWYKDKEGYNGYDFNTPVTEDMVIYAKWIEHIGRTTVLVQLPVHDGKPAAPTVTASQYVIDHYVWNNKIDSDSPMGENETFEESKQYKLQVWLKIKDNNYYFDDTTMAVFNGGLPATLVKYEDSLLLAEIIFTVPEEGMHTVMFDMNSHGNQIAELTVKDGETVAEPAAPKDSGYLFDGWYTDAAFKKPYDFNTPVTDDLILYAKWRSLVSYAEISVPVPAEGEGPGVPGLASSLCSIADYQWIDTDSGTALGKDALFEPGHTYLLRMKIRMDSESFYFDDSTRIVVNGEDAATTEVKALELTVERTFRIEGEAEPEKPAKSFDPELNRIVIIASAVGSLVVTGLLIFLIIKRHHEESAKKANASRKAQESGSDDEFFDE